MAEQQISLLPLYKCWDAYQGLLLKALEPLTAEQLSLRAAPNLRSIGENAAHIAGTRAGWLYFVLGRTDERLLPMTNDGWVEQAVGSVDRLLKALQDSWLSVQETLSAWTTADLDEIVHDVDENGADETYTRQWVIWHLIEHDTHHGGELSFTLGMHGLTGIDI